MTDDVEKRLRALELEVASLRGQIDMLVKVRGEVKNGERSNGSGGQRRERKKAIEVLMGMTPKQHAVVQMLAEGMGTEDMAGVLGVHLGTVKVHIRGVMKRASVKTRAQIMMMWREATADLTEEEYEAFAGIPMDWAKRPEAYPSVSEMLRTKVR